MTDNENYHQHTLQYEKHLKAFIEEKYALNISKLTVLSWGYTTTAYYIESDKGKFIARLSPFSKEKQAGLTKDVSVSHILKEYLPIPTYLNARDGNFLLGYTDYNSKKSLLRISDFSEGMTALDITMENVEDMARFLNLLHFGLAERVITELRKVLNAHDGVFLHGDLTPTNTIISHGKIVRYVDFEHAFFGPVEYDLARTAVFSWFLLSELSFEELTQNIAKSYEASFEQEKYLEFAKLHLNTHFENIKKHKSDYEDPTKFSHDLAFAEKMLSLFTAYLKSKGLS